MPDSVLKNANPAEFSLIQTIAQSPQDGPVLRRNLNLYGPAADYPNGEL